MTPGSSSRCARARRSVRWNNGNCPASRTAEVPGYSLQATRHCPVSFPPDIASVTLSDQRSFVTDAQGRPRHERRSSTVRGQTDRIEGGRPCPWTRERGLTPKILRSLRYTSKFDGFSGVEQCRAGVLRSDGRGSVAQESLHDFVAAAGHLPLPSLRGGGMRLNRCGDDTGYWVRFTKRAAQWWIVTRTTSRRPSVSRSA